MCLFFWPSVSLTVFLRIKWTDLTAGAAVDATCRPGRDFFSKNYVILLWFKRGGVVVASFSFRRRRRLTICFRTFFLRRCWRCCRCVVVDVVAATAATFPRFKQNCESVLENPFWALMAIGAKSVIILIINVSLQRMLFNSLWKRNCNKQINSVIEIALKEISTSL